MGAAETTIYVELLDEGVHAWRPVAAIHEAGSIYRLPQLTEPGMTGEVWAFPPGSLVHCEIRHFSDGPGLVVTRRATAADLQSISNSSKLRSGIDLLVEGRPELGALVCALETVAGIAANAVKLPHDGEDKRLALFNHPVWAVVHAYEAGGFGYKVDLEGIEPRDYTAIARQLAKALDVAIVWPDETTLSANAFVIFHPDGIEQPLTMDD